MDHKMNKKTALVIGAVIIAIIILFLRLSKGAVSYQSNGAGNVTLGDVTLGGITLDITRTPFSLPAFALPPDQFSMISGCCSDCSKSTATVGYQLAPRSGNTFVFNEGNKAGDVFNYYEAPKVTTPFFVGYGTVGGR